jgi:outer membrane protein assembly factor BamB
MARRCLQAILVLGLIGVSAYGAISAALPLASIIDSDYVFVAKIESVDATKPSMVLNIQEDLDGKSPFRRIAVLLNGDDDAKKDNHVPQLLKRIEADLPMVWFVAEREKKLVAQAFTNGTWMRISGTIVEKDRAVWQLEHGEPNLRKTYSGTTKELIELVRGVLAKKMKAPPINDKVAPGFGPELPAKKTHLAPPRFNVDEIEVQFAVIPTVALMGPLAILAILFPAVFGGVLILFRQWTAFITFFSVNSTLYLLYWWKGAGWYRDSWWGSEAGLWFIMTLVTAACVMWAWRRQLKNLASGADALETPPRTEYLVLSILTVSCLAFVLGTFWLAPPMKTDIVWNLTLVITGAVFVGLIYKFVRGVIETMLPMATEGVMLGAALLGHLLVLSVFAGESTGGNRVEKAEQDANGSTKFLGMKWEFTTKQKGVFVSSPLIVDGRVIAASAHPAQKWGNLLSLDLDTGKEMWRFTDSGDLKQVFSTPTFNQGKIYLGEGFHEDPRCKFYCVDAADGKKVWEHQSTSQTEASPIAVDGKVFMGCGNDGFFCFAADAKDKANELWRFPTKDSGGRLLRFGSGAAVAEGRVFVGTGVDRLRKDDKGETALFCLDAITGKQVWKVAMPLPIWGSPVWSEGKLFVGAGNGDVISDAEQPAGLLLCLDPATGSEVWKLDLPNGIIQRVAVDERQVYAGCRDGNCCAIDRATGQIAWKANLGSAVVASPALARSSPTARTTSVFAAGSGGKIACLDPDTGRESWSFIRPDSQFLATPAVFIREVGGDLIRYIIVGTGDVSATSRAAMICLKDCQMAK